MYVYMYGMYVYTYSHLYYLFLAIINKQENTTCFKFEMPDTLFLVSNGGKRKILANSSTTTATCAEECQIGNSSSRWQ